MSSKLYILPQPLPLNGRCSDVTGHFVFSRADKLAKVGYSLPPQYGAAFRHAVELLHSSLPSPSLVASLYWISQTLLDTPSTFPSPRKA